jgi:hypothetical protein
MVINANVAIALLQTEADDESTPLSVDAPPPFVG